MRQHGALRFLSLHFWLVPVSALRAEPVPHTISRRDGGIAAAPLHRFVGHRFKEAGDSGSVTLLRPSPGTSADISVCHALSPATWLRHQSAQRHRALLGPPVKTLVGRAFRELFDSWSHTRPPFHHVFDSSRRHRNLFYVCNEREDIRSTETFKFKCKVHSKLT